MKKIVSILLVSILVISTLSGCGTAPTPAPAPSVPSSVAPAAPADTPDDGKVMVDGMLWPVKPLEKKTKLTVSYLSNSTAEVATYLADTLGWLEACNIEVEMVYFAGGPAQMEASNSWEVGTTGIGGVVNGILNYDIKTLGVVAQDKGLFQAFYARKDSDIVAAGKGKTAIPELYGTPETWKGKSILTAVGTANQYALYHTLKALGLQLSDVKVINMDIATTPTAFLAGQGDIAGVQGMMIQDELFQKADSDYVLVSSDQMLGSGLSVNYVTTPKAWGEKQEAIELWLELAIMAGEWANANQQETSEMMVAMFEIDGYETKAASNFKMINENPFTTLDNNYKFFTEKDAGNTMLQAKEQIINAANGYVEMGNYTKEQLDKLIASNSFAPESILKIYGNRAAYTK